jgi:hypothetical protein
MYPWYVLLMYLGIVAGMIFFNYFSVKKETPKIAGHS